MRGLMQMASPEDCFSTKESTKESTNDSTTGPTGAIGKSVGRWRLAFVAVVVVVMGLALSGQAHAANPTEIRARQSFAAGRYQDALDLFAQLYAETLHPVYLRNIGRCHQKLREPQKAIDSFLDYLAKEKKITVDERQEIEGYVKEMQALIDQQKQQAPSAAAAPAVPVATPPPERTAAPTSPVVSAPGPAPKPLLAPAPSDQAAPSALLVQVPSATERPSDTSSSPPIYTRWWFWTAIGAAAVGTVAAVFLIPGGVTKPTCVAEAMGNCK